MCGLLLWVQQIQELNKQTRLGISMIKTPNSLDPHNQTVSILTNKQPELSCQIHSADMCLHIGLKLSLDHGLYGSKYRFTEGYTQLNYSLKLKKATLKGL